MDDWKVEENDNEFIIKIPREKNYTLGDLKQKLINDLMSKNTILSDHQAEINLLKIILDYENNNNLVHQVKKDLKEYKDKIKETKFN